MKLLDDLRNLDRNNIGGWPKSVKNFFTVLLFGSSCWWLGISLSTPARQLQNLAGKEEQLKQEFSDQAGQVGQSRSAATAARRDERHAASAAASVAQQDRNA
jgi:Tfp pilus assembly protein PilO